ncbi:MAG: ribonuclease P protein component [Ignavibacteria bacterium]|nr:ribonuclease P protein component [Ignavibacteria bacterium]
MRHSLKRSEVLRGKKNFRHVFAQGKKIEGKILHCLFYEFREKDVTGTAAVIFGVAVPRNVKRAVDRNRIKRLIREAYRLNKNLLQDFQKGDSDQTISCLFVYTSRSAHVRSPVSFREVNNDMKTILATLARTLDRKHI